MLNTIKLHAVAKCIHAYKNIADSEQNSRAPDGSHTPSGNIKQKETDSPLHNATSQQQKKYMKFQTPC